MKRSQMNRQMNVKLKRTDFQLISLLDKASASELKEQLAKEVRLQLIYSGLSASALKCGLI